MRGQLAYNPKTDVWSWAAVSRQGSKWGLFSVKIAVHGLLLRRLRRSSLTCCGLCLTDWPVPNYINLCLHPTVRVYEYIQLTIHTKYKKNSAFLALQTVSDSCIFSSTIQIFHSLAKLKGSDISPWSPNVPTSLIYNLYRVTPCISNQK